MAVRVLLIEDNDVFRTALEVLLTLGGDIEIAGSETDGNAVVERCREARPDVVLVDYRLPGLDGVQVTRLVRDHAPGVAVVALTAAAGEREVAALLEAGAVACIGKDRPLDEIIEAVRDAAPLEAPG
jgi:DNA-binding NarL/FixJ family response regulator